MWICVNCGQTHNRLEFREEVVKKIHELEIDGFNSQDTCWYCRMVRKNK